MTLLYLSHHAAFKYGGRATTGCVRALLTPFLGTCPGWQDKMIVCGLRDELPMRMVADKGEVGRD